MLDIRQFRENPDHIRERLATRGEEFAAKVDDVLRLDTERREAITAVEELKAMRNAASKEIGALMGQKKLEEAEAKKALLPDPQCPEGMTRMPDDERLQSLNDLKRRKAEIKAELFKLPLNVNSMRARKHQEALHKALDDVENSIKIFERPVVYIQA